MIEFNQWDIVVVPFPYTDRTTTKRRPALVVSADNLLHQHGLLWVLMITSAKNARWEGDVEIEDYEAVGLPAPSLIRTAKIATIEAGLVLRKLGAVDEMAKAEIKKRLSETIP